MNYQNIYNNIIERSKNRNLQSKYKEIHHIIPKCLGGLDDNSNLTELTLREHYICHKLLSFIYPNNRSLAHAYWMMTASTYGAIKNLKEGNLLRKDGYSIKRIQGIIDEGTFISSHDYEFARKYWLDICEKLNVKRTKEQRKKISNATISAMKTTEVLEKVKINKGSRWYYDPITLKTYHWYTGTPEPDMTKYKWGRPPLSKEQKKLLSKTQTKEKTIYWCEKHKLRYMFYTEYYNHELKGNWINLNQRQKNCKQTLNISKEVLKILGELKLENIFLDNLFFNPKDSHIIIIAPKIVEYISELDSLDNFENSVKNYILNNYDEIQKYNNEILKLDLLKSK